MVNVGDVVAGKYRIDRVLGKGAMGAVVGAWHLKLQRPVAIKFMLPEALGDRDGVERFMREARAAARLKSQHAVEVFDVDTHSSGAPYIVMEHLDGIDLRTLQKQRGALPVGEAATYILQACEAIAEAHQSGIIHRDLKPANLFLASGVGGRPCLKILDFGIAKVVEGTNPATSSEHLTSTYAVMGTPFFMSPEQIISTRDVDGRSDIWSLGVILYSFVTGQFPFTGSNSYDIFDEVRRKEPTSPSVMQPDIPLAFTTIILRCLEKDPTRRFQECAELAQALLPFASSRSELSFPSVPIASTMLDLGMSTPGQDAPSTRTVPGGLIPLARLAVVEPHPAQTGAPTTQMPPGPTATPRQSRAITLLGGALGLALVLAAGLTLRRFHGEPSAEPAATSFTVTSLASTASAQPTAALLIVPSSVAAAAPPSASAEGAVLATGSPGGRSSGAPKNADGEQKLRKSAAEPKPPATLMPTSAGPVTPPPPAQTAAPVAASSKAPSKSRWDDRNQ